MKVVIGEGPYGFGLSEEAMKLIWEQSGEKIQEWVYREFTYLRIDPVLIDVIEHLGENRAGGQHGNLKIINVPDEYGFEIRLERYYNGEMTEEWEELYLVAREDYLRQLIQEGAEDKIVEYAMNSGRRVYE